MKPPEASTLAILAFGVIFGLASKRLLRPDPITPFRDRKATTITSRGAAFDYVVGRHRPNVIFAWVGKRTTSNGRTYEEGLHMLHASRIRAMHKIVEDGKVLYDFGPAGIRSSYPGIPENPPMTYQAANGQAFTVFWGHPDPASDPGYTSLAEAGRLGIGSRWPGTCMVWWHSKRLTEAEQWPLMEYEISVEPQVEHLTRTARWMGSSRDLDTSIPQQQITGFSKVGARWRVSVAGDLVAEFGPAKFVQLDFINSPEDEDSGAYEIDAAQHIAPLGSQSSLPVATVSAGAWVNDGGSGVLHSAIDEPVSSPNDADYIHRPAGIGSDSCELRLGSLTSPGSGGGHSFNVRYRKENTSSGNGSATLRVEMLNAVSSAKTVFYTREFLIEHFSLGAGNGPWVNQSVTIPASSILSGLFNYTDIGVRFTLISPVNGPVQISAFEFVVVDQGRTEIFLIEGYDFDLVGIYFGTAQPYLEGADGVNPAHFVAELLLDPEPRGKSLPPELFDLETFEVAAERLLEEHLPINARWQDLPNADAILGSVLQDMGMLLRLDPISGLWGLHLVREDEPIIDVPPEMLAGPAPSRVKVHGPKKANRLLYSIEDRSRGFRSTGYAVNDDGEASRSGDRRDSPIPIKTQTDFRVAVDVAERRALENEIQEGSGVSLRGFGWLRDVCAGSRLRLSGSSEILRVVSTRPQALSSVATVETAPDLYGVTSTNTVSQESVIAAVSSQRQAAPLPVENAAEALFELPDALQAVEGGQDVALLQIRGSARVSAGELQVSTDGGVLFSSSPPSSSFAAGGELDDDWPVGDAVLQDGVAPTLTLLGPDGLSVIQDLVGDEVAWRSGKQLLVIGDEIAFLEGVTWLDETTVHLGRIIRARYGTRQSAHAAGDRVFILPATALTALDVPGLEPGMTVHWRVVPHSGGLALDVEDVEEHLQALVGRGVVPPAPENLRTESGAPAYFTGEDIALRWSFRRGEGRRVGAGHLAAGVRTSRVRPRGGFGIRVTRTDTGQAVQLPGTIEAEMVLTNAALLDAFGAEPPSLSFEVVHIVEGFASEPATLEVVKL